MSDLQIEPEWIAELPVMEPTGVEVLENGNHLEGQLLERATKVRMEIDGVNVPGLDIGENRFVKISDTNTTNQPRFSTNGARTGKVWKSNNKAKFAQMFNGKKGEKPLDKMPPVTEGTWSVDAHDSLTQGGVE